MVASVMNRDATEIHCRKVKGCSAQLKAKLKVLFYHLKTLFNVQTICK
jgi:hypothetical protein